MTAGLDALSGRPVIVGGGIAGLTAALFLAPEPVVLVTRAPLGTDGSSPLAQGGIAASVGQDDDADLHLADTLGAGDGLCDADAARRILAAGPEAVAALERLGVAFDRTGDGALALGLEAAHSRRRIVHADGDGTGRELVRALTVAALACPSITVVEAEARRILVQDGAVAGLMVAGPAGGAVLRTRRLVLATGGVGALYEHTTNPASSFGLGLALAAEAGAELADLEFVQFHPTALATPARPLTLVSEAVRGEGAILVDGAGRRFLEAVPGAELAPRDVVARAVWREITAGREVFLDARTCLGARFPARFPAIAAGCRAAGIDPVTDLVPIRPAAHYHMGGIAVDAEGRSTVEGLWAAGEVASTGLHGANRLASNSLLEAVVCGRAVAASIAGTPERRSVRLVPATLPAAPDPARVRPVVSRFVGVTRDAAGLSDAVSRLLPLAAGEGPAAAPAKVGLMMAVSALAREESRGAHARTDFPTPARAVQRSRLTLDGAFAAARRIAAPERVLAFSN
ncbi:L-aspartate oxidase [Xanthobacter autotrophicus DSM 431]|uniref:L-aspartate oxidase n=1 Tax=Xanthobacter nonsaccharivorans TaxID=3119912 RepID=UPI003727AA72